VFLILLLIKPMIELFETWAISGSISPTNLLKLRLRLIGCVTIHFNVTPGAVFTNNAFIHSNRATTAIPVF
jgi:hypothetical protein